MEIERKFLITHLPPSNLREGRGAEILQGYVITDPGELRLLQKGDRHFITVKGDGTLSRDEWEQEIPQWVFKTLWPQTEGLRIEKTRYSIPYLHGWTLEVDEYHGALAGLLTLEVEFSSEEEAAKSRLPIWTDGRDVTADKRYKNKALAVNGLPFWHRSLRAAYTEKSAYAALCFVARGNTAKRKTPHRRGFS